MNKLEQLRDIIASLDETLVRALCQRAVFKTNEEMYNELKRPISSDECATLFSTATSVAGRVHILRPLFINSFLPVLCAQGLDEDRRKCIAADSNCLNALAQRLNLSVHVAALKLEEMPDALRIPLMERDAVALEVAITNQAVEANVIARILKMSGSQTPLLRHPERIAHIYETWVIPISRKIQINDLLAKHRLG